MSAAPRKLADKIEKVLEGETVSSGIHAIGIVLSSLLYSIVEEEGPSKAERIVEIFVSTLQISHTHYVQEVYKKKWKRSL